VARKSEWIPRISRVLAVLEDHPTPLLDRRAIERVFQVSPRQALRILVQLGASELGKNLVISRDELISRLRSVAAGETAQYERRRLRRLAQTLTDLEVQTQAQRVTIAASPQAHQMKVASLPANVHLTPGRLEIVFATPEDLLTCLFELSQAIANDYSVFESRLKTGYALQRTGKQQIPVSAMGPTQSS
jgi:hypothetical protein